MVAAGATGAASIVKDGVTGQLVPPTRDKIANAAAFAEAIAPYCTDPALRRSHGAAGEARSREYSWEAINQVVADTYIRLVEERRAVQEAEAIAAVAA